MKNIIQILSILLLSAVVFNSCKKTGEDSGIAVNAVEPSITTNDATGISGTNATIGGTITTDGGSLIKESGICYSTTSGVDTTDNKKTSYKVSGSFSVALTGLSLLSTYYYRAYAINEKGLVYGEEKSFFVPVGGYSASSEVAAADLVAHWAFEDNYVEAVSTTAGTANHPTAISFVSNGIKGKAVQVESPGYINSNITNTVSDLGSFTMTCWILQPASLAGGPTTFFPFSLNKAGYSWEQTKFFMLFNNPDNATNSYGKVCLMDQWFDAGQVWPKMLDGSWHQMSISYNNTSGALRVYVDGVLISQSASTTLNPQANFGGADSFTLGGPDDATHTANGWMNSLSGDLDEFRIYKSALSVSDIQALYALESHGL